MMKVVVFGGSGFLGSHVADALTSAGYDVHIFDRTESPYRQDDQRMIRGDILDQDAISRAVAGAHAVYHFAGISDIHEANCKPLEVVKCNVLGTANILDACARERVSRFVFASSVYVYSERGGFYRSSKQACELLIENYSKLYGLAFTTLRFGSLYGGRANGFNFIDTIIRQALTEGRMERKGDGEEIREYIHVKDAARACVSVLDEKFRNEYLMITGGQSIKVKDLLLMINEMLDDKVEIRFSDAQIEEHYEMSPYSFRPRMARKFIQDTRIDLGQGILDTIYEVHKDIHAAENSGEGDYDRSGRV